MQQGHLINERGNAASLIGRKLKKDKVALEKAGEKAKEALRIL